MATEFEAEHGVENDIVAPSIDAPVLVAGKPISTTLHTPSAHAPKATGKAGVKRSFFKSDKTAPASKVDIEGETFYFDALSDEAREIIEGAPAEIAAAMGLSLEELEKMKTEDLTLSQSNIQRQSERNQQDCVLADAARDWTLPVPFGASVLRDLHDDVRRDWVEAILAFSFAGVGEARFRRARSAPPR